MNDPNGLIWHGGLYHLYFQHNPHGDRHGNMSWGHATSPDLATWTQQPVALLHDDTHDVFSGSVVWDENNTSGLAPEGLGPLVAIYTTASRAGDHQAQALAFSLDGGFTWEKYDGNPVLDLGTDDFRDPKVFRYSGEAGDWWVMVAVEARSRRVVLYRSDDLLTWSYLSSYGPAGSVEGFWECPDLFPLAVEGEAGNVHWVLLVSVATGAVAGGSGTQYVVGHFDGHIFTPATTLPAVDGASTELKGLPWLDRGPDCYAGVTFSGLPDDERTLVAWMNNWDYAQDFPSSPWRGSMTIPRRLSLHRRRQQLVLAQTPILPAGVRAATLTDHELDALAAELVESLPDACRISARIEHETGDPSRLVILNASGGTLSITYDPTTALLEVNRTSSTSFHPAFPSRQTGRYQTPDGILDLQIVLDTSSAEIFIGDGEPVFTDQIDGDGPRALLGFAIEGRTVVTSLLVDELTPHPNGAK